MLLEPRPLLWLGGQEEVEDIGRDQAEAAVVVVLAALVEAAGQGVVAVRRRGLPQFGDVVRVGVGAVLEEGALDGQLEGAF